MIDLTQRQKNIIKILLDSNNYLTMKDISKTLGLSTRTILRNFKEIEKWFKENDFKLSIKTGVGLLINENEEIKQYILELLYFEKTKTYSALERKIFIMSSLLYTDEPIKMSYLIKILSISKNTFDEDLMIIDKSLDKFNLKLERKPGIGCYLQGNEKDLRNCYLNMILDYFKEKDLIECFKSLLQVDKNYDFFNHNIILKIFDKETLAIICNCVDCNIRNLDFILTDESYIEFIIHLAIAIKRIDKSCWLNVNKYNLNKFLNTEHFKIIKNICTDLETELKIIFSLEEILFLTEILKTLKFIKMEYTLDNIELLNETNKLINLVENDLNISLIYDKIFLNDLLNHLETSIYRMKLKLKIENAFLQEVKNEYFEMYESISKNIVLIKEKFNISDIPEEEIGYITMHFLVAYERVLKNVPINAVLCCHSGIGTSKILLNEIKQKFQNINVLEVIPSFKLNQYKHNVDLIISTINLDTDVPFIKLNPILDFENEKKLKQVSLKLAKNKLINKKDLKQDIVFEKINEDDIFKVLNLSDDIKHIVKKYTHLLYYEPLDIDSILEDLSEILVEDIKNKKNLIKDFKRRIDIQLPFFEEFDLLFLHCITKSVNNIKILTAKLKNPIVFLEKTITYILVVVVPEDTNVYQNQLVSEISLNIINNESFVESIKFSEEKEILFIIKKILLNFYQEKIKELI